MSYLDSTHKIITRYIIPVTTEIIEYREALFSPSRIFIHPDLFNTFYCPPDCGVCCKGYTLDYLPWEVDQLPDWLQSLGSFKTIIFNKKKFTYWSYTQKDESTCIYLDSHGRCCIHKVKPFSCYFPPIKFIQMGPLVSNWPTPYVLLTTDLFSNVPSQKCSFGKWTSDSILTVQEKLTRLSTWCDYFKVKTKLDIIKELLFKEGRKWNIK